MKILFIGSEFLGSIVKTYLHRDNKNRTMAFVKDYMNACGLMRIWQPDLVIHEWDEDDCSGMMVELASSYGMPVLAFIPSARNQEPEVTRELRRRLNKIDRSETLEKPVPGYADTPAFKQRLISSIRRLECIVKPKPKAA